MREIQTVYNTNGAYETVAHEHDEFMLLVPEHGALRVTDENNNWSTTLVERQFLLVPPRWAHSSASLSQYSISFRATTARPQHMTSRAKN